MIEPIQPKAPPSLLAQAPQPQHEPAYEADRHFMPPVPEPVVRGARMPTIDDLPAPGRAILAAQQGGGDPTESRRRSLLERLAAFSLRGSEDTAQAAPVSAPAPAAPAPAPRPRAPMPPQPAPAQRPQPGAVHAEYARRPQAPAPAVRQQQLDFHGRAAPAAQRAEDDHLEIPAFLRRQSS